MHYFSDSLLDDYLFWFLGGSLIIFEAFVAIYAAWLLMAASNYAFGYGEYLDIVCNQICHLAR